MLNLLEVLPKHEILNDEEMIKKEMNISIYEFNSQNVNYSNSVHQLHNWCTLTKYRYKIYDQVTSNISNIMTKTISVTY